MSIEDFITEEVEASGLNIRVTTQLVVAGQINYCPMCGRDLRGDES